MKECNEKYHMDLYFCKSYIGKLIYLMVLIDLPYPNVKKLCEKTKG